MDGETVHVNSNNSVIPVEISKLDLHDVSGPKIIRDSHLQTIAAALNQQLGVMATVDPKNELVRTDATPVATYTNQPMIPDELRSQVKSAADHHARDGE